MRAAIGVAAGKGAALNLRSRLRSALAWSAVGTWLREGMNFVVFGLLARLLGPEAYGLVAMAMVVAALAQISLVDGIGTVLVQRRDLEPGHVDSVFWLLIGIGGAIALAMWLLAAPLARVYGEPAVAPLMHLLSALPLLYALAGVQVAQLKRELLFGALALRGILAALAGGAVGVGLALQGYGVWSLAWMFLAQWTVQVLVLWTASPWRPGLAASRRHLADIAAYCTHTVSTRGVQYAEQQIPRLVIGATLGPAAVGLFTMGWRLLEMLSVLLLMPINQVALPLFSRVQDQRERLERALASLVQLSALLAFPAYLGLAAVAPDLVPVLFGERWAAAVPVVQIMALMGLQWALTYGLGALMAGTGETRWRLWLNLVNLAALAPVLLLSLPHGTTAVAAAMVLRGLLLLPLNLHVLRRQLKVRLRPLLSGIWPIALASLVMLVAVLGWRHLTAAEPAPLRLAGAVLVGALAYGLALLLLARPMLLSFAGIALAGRRSDRPLRRAGP